MWKSMIIILGKYRVIASVLIVLLTWLVICLLAINKRKSGVKTLNAKETVKHIYNQFFSLITQLEYEGLKRWGNSGNDNGYLDTYKYCSGDKTFYIAITEWVKAGTDEPNRYAILINFQVQITSTLSPTWELILPFNDSKMFDTRLYTVNGKTEIRRYGKFTIGKRSILRNKFFEYLRDIGEYSDVHIDDDGKPFLRMFTLDDTIDNEVLINRLCYLTTLIYDYKNYCRSFS